MVFEVNFDGIVGPNHNYAGLSDGNMASKKNSKAISNPKKAALQGLDKMKALADMGINQGILPPHRRPNMEFLHSIGYTGDDKKMIASLWKDNPSLALACFSASPMWTANAATVSPWLDCRDGLTHFTPANLSAMFHRSFESQYTAEVLKTIFSNQQYFKHHDPLPAGLYFGDEGAANHTRLSANHASAGIELFVYGGQSFGNAPRPTKYPARQSLEASQAIVRLHNLLPEQCVFAQQNPDAIDRGVFHNDVIAVGSNNLLFYHQLAFLNSRQVIDEIQRKMQRLHPDAPMHFVKVSEQDISIEEAVSTYLFNSQLIDISQPDEDNHFIIIAPGECRENENVYHYLQTLIQSSNNPINSVHYFDLRQSMQNGGGPACLRLRVVMNEQQRQSVQANVFMNDERYQQLTTWVNRHYRDQLTLDDLQDSNIIDEFNTALSELSTLLNL